MKLLLQMGIGEGRIPLSAKGGVNGGCEGHNIDTSLTLRYGVRSRINIRLLIEWCIEGVKNEAGQGRRALGGKARKYLLAKRDSRTYNSNPWLEKRCGEIVQRYLV